MGGATLLFDYLTWHYTSAYRYALLVWANFMWFIVHFFSLPLLFRTLFSPWKRMREEYHRGGFEDIAGVVIVNAMSRLVGFLVRFFFIVLGFLSLLVLVVGLLFWFILWTFFPILLLAATLSGIKFILV